jgi:signal transduction histidine kinase
MKIGLVIEDNASFVRLQTSLTEKTPGTGLGLYLVKKLAKDFLGGDVEVESEFGKGSKFTLNIPIELEPIHKIN